MKRYRYNENEDVELMVYQFFESAVGRNHWFPRLLPNDKRIGCVGGSDFQRCSFPGFYDEDEPEYFGKTGVALFIDYPAADADCMIFLTNEEYLTEVAKWSKIYREKNPKDSECVETLLADIRENFERWYCFERKQM